MNENPLLGMLVRVFDPSGEPLAGIHDYARLIWMSDKKLILRIWNGDSEDGGEINGWFQMHSLDRIGVIDTLGYEEDEE
jgi:hypothetical protein